MLFISFLFQGKNAGHSIRFIHKQGGIGPAFHSPADAALRSKMK